MAEVSLSVGFILTYAPPVVFPCQYFVLFHTPSAPSLFLHPMFDGFRIDCDRSVAVNEVVIVTSVCLELWYESQHEYGCTHTTN